jgi:hypothetical protein
MINPELGTAVLEYIEENTGRNCHLIMIVLPAEDDGKLGQPSFVTNMPPVIMQEVLVSIAGSLPLLGDPTIAGVTRQ